MIHWLKRWWSLTLGAVLFVVVAWFTPGIWLRIDGWIQQQRDLVWAQFEELVGQKVIYDRISPNVLAALEFQNVRVLADDGTPVLTANSIRLSLDWNDLFQGRINEALRKVQIINGTLNVDERRDRSLLDHWFSILQPSTAGSSTAFGFEVEGFNLTARWTDGVRSLALDRVFLLLSPEGDQWGLRYRGAVSWEDTTGKRDYVRTSVRGEMRSDAAFQNLRLRTEASLVRTSWFDLEPLTLQITVSPQEVSLTKVADRIPLDLQAVWNPSSNVWQFKGAAEDFRPSRLIRIKDQKLWAGLAEGTVSGQFSYQLWGDFTFTGSAQWPLGSLPEPFNKESVRMDGTVKSSGTLFWFENFFAETDQVRLGFDGNLESETWFPEGTLRVEQWFVPSWGTASGTISVSRLDRRLFFAGESLQWNDLAAAASGWVEQTGSNWSFEGSGVLKNTDGQFSTSGTFDPALWQVSAGIEFQSIPLAHTASEIQRYAPDFELPPELWALEVGTKAQIVLSPQDFVVLNSSFQFQDPEKPERNGFGMARWKDRQLELSNLEVQWDQVKAKGNLSAWFLEDGPIDWSLAGNLWDRAISLSGRWVPSDRTVVFSGSPGLRGSLHQNPAGLWSAELSLDPYEAWPGWILAFSSRGTWDGENWAIDADQVDFSGKYPWNQEDFRIRTQLTANSRHFRLDEMTLEDSRGRLSGAVSSSWSVDFSEPWAGRLSLATASTETESLTLDWVGEALDLWHFNLKASGIDITRLPLQGIQGIQGKLALSGTADWAGKEVNWSAQTALSESRIGETPLGFRANLSGTTRRLAVRSWNLSMNPVFITNGSLDWDADLQTWNATLGMGLRLGTGDWQSRWTTQGSWTGDPTSLQVEFNLNTKDNTWLRRSFPDGSLKGTWDKTSWQAVWGDGGLTAQGLSDGSFKLRAKDPFPIRAEADGVWKNNTFTVAVRDFQADLSMIKEFINSKSFALTSGTAIGGFTLSGSPSDPEVNGNLLLKNVTAESVFVRRPLGPVDIPLVAEGHRVWFDPVNVAPKGSTWMVSGTSRLDHLLPEEYQITIQTDSLSPIPGSYLYKGLSAIGDVTGLIVIKGTPLAVTLGGRLVIQDTLVTLKDSEPIWDSDGSLGFNADLTLVTGRKVEFLWPNATLPLLRAVTAGNQTLQFKSSDIANSWSLVGKVGLRTGEINYLNRTFLIKEGLLGFQENQNGFDPHLQVRAEWKYRETDGTTTVNLNADGTLAKFSPRFDAVPYKSADELQQLVGTTLALPTDYTKTTNLDTALSVASDVGTSFLLTPFEETVKKNFNLDLFTVKTEILKKSLLSRNGPMEASDYLDNTRLFFGKYIGDDLFLQGTLAFRRDGSIVTQVSPEMVVKPEFQMEFQTPFFLLNWTLLPQHPETLFVTDNTVTFRWNWSY